MPDLFSQVNALFQNNQMLSTIAGGSVIVWCVSNIKSLWGRLVSGVNTLISFTIVNTYELALTIETDTAQEVFNQLVANTKILWERSRNLDLSTRPSRIGKGESSLAYGFSIRIMFGKLVFCHRSIDRQQKITVNTNLRVYFASQKKFMKTLMDYIYAEVIKRISEQEKRDQIRVRTVRSCGYKNKRLMDTLFTNNDEHYQLLNSIKDFIDKKEIYRKLSYPYSYSALLYGEPGCGKTSTILAIASALDKDICYVNLAKISLNGLLEVLNDRAGSIFVFEDIDAINTTVNADRGALSLARKGTPVEEVVEICDKDVPEEPARAPGEMSALEGLFGASLSDLLNVTDGLLASDGSICLFTTNHIERLDPALLRAGRMNMCVKFAALNQQTAAKMIKANLDWDIDPELLNPCIKPAELQETILHVVLGKATRQDLVDKFCKTTEKEGN